MEITIKYFGIIADITQKKEEVLIAENDVNTVKKIKSIIEINYSNILNIKYSISVNKKLITNCDVELNHKDEIAFLPPFAGG